MDLFNYSNGANKMRPLADRMRADTLSKFIGQEHIVYENSLLSRAIKTNSLGSCIFFGPPGCGKTTLAHVISNTLSGRFVKLSAVTSGVADIKTAAAEARDAALMHGKKTYLLLDECHRFSKTQSDSLLPFIEDGTIIFIGSTTENPYAAMTPSIVSRCRVFEFFPLKKKHILLALKGALADTEKGLGNYKVEADEDALAHISEMASGDLRAAYNALELAVLTTSPRVDGTIRLTLKDAEESIQKKALSFDTDLYYHLISAFCKSLRGSDSDAALYYMQRLIQGGCDSMLIARRLVVHSSEDVGMADPSALTVCVAAMTALEKIGLPEALIPLSQAIIHVCESEKSNSVVKALNLAKSAAEISKDDAVPPYLKDNSYIPKQKAAESAKYKYPHDFGGYVKQQYLPDSLKDRVFYTPTQNGFEKEVFLRRQKRK